MHSQSRRGDWRHGIEKGCTCPGVPGRRAVTPRTRPAPYAQAVAPSTAVPAIFAHAVRGLRATTPRPEIEIEEINPPARLAPYAFAVSASVERDEEDL